MTVHVLSAKLGRMEENACINTKENLGCYDDLSQEMRERCYGKQTCSVFVGTLGEFMQSCPKNIMPYLHIDTECRIGMSMCLYITTVTTIATAVKQRPESFVAGRGLASNLAMLCGLPQALYMLHSSLTSAVQFLKRFKFKICTIINEKYHVCE